MVRYPDTLSLLKARALFFRDAKLGPDGGYSDRWVCVETKPIPFYFPNRPSLVAAARLHGLHHSATDYETDWPAKQKLQRGKLRAAARVIMQRGFLTLAHSGSGLSLHGGDFSRVPARTPHKDKLI
jgi:hypothetical protein